MLQLELRAMVKKVDKAFNISESSNIKLHDSTWARLGLPRQKAD